MDICQILNFKIDFFLAKRMLYVCILQSFLVYLFNFYYAISELEQNKQNNTIIFFFTIYFFNKKVDLSSLRGGAGAPIAPPLPTGLLFGLYHPPPGISSLASYIPFKSLVIQIPHPLKIFDDLLWCGRGYFLDLHINRA